MIDTLPCELVVVVVWALWMSGVVDWEHCSEDGIAETPIVCVEYVGDAALAFKESGQFLMCSAIWIESIGIGEMQLQASAVNQIRNGVIAREGLIVSWKFI